ncbi:hypothetical protein BASA84_001253 [Batrachochytrium salamandrivorans]|nr:hypothetical protein BASA84_001253 [Batrachochytrium salamandrivorans]
MITDYTADNSNNDSLLLADLQQSIDYVNRELVGLGLSAALSFKVAAESHSEVKMIVACIFSLLQQRQRDLVFRSDLQERLQLLLSDNDAMAATISRQKSKEESLERQISSVQNKLVTSTKAADKTAAKLLAMKEELKTTTTASQYSKAQYTHEIRRKTLEFNRLQQRLQKIVTEKLVSKAGMKLANPLPHSLKEIPNTSDGGVASIKQDHSEEMYSIVMKNYEDREKQIMAENESLRQTLFVVFNDMKEYIELNHGQFVDGQIQKLRPETMLALPPLALRHPIQQAIEQGLNVLGSIQSGVSSEVSQELEAKVESLTKQIEDQKEAIAEQTRLLELALDHDFAVHTSAENESFMGADEDTEAQQTELQEQWQKLEMERRKFTDSAIRMGLERAALQHERVQFEEEKRSHDTMQFLRTLSPSSTWLKSNTPLVENMQPNIPSSPLSKGISLIKKLRDAGLNEPADITNTNNPQTHHTSVHLENASKDDFLVESDTFIAANSNNTTRASYLSTPGASKGYSAKRNPLSPRVATRTGWAERQASPIGTGTMAASAAISSRNIHITGNISSPPHPVRSSRLINPNPNSTPFIKSAFRDKDSSRLATNTPSTLTTAQSSRSVRSVRIAENHSNSASSTAHRSTVGSNQNNLTPFRPTLAMSTPS